MPQLQLLVLSDLHLDHHALPLMGADGRRIDAGADVVVLAGDIDEGLKGLRWAAQSFPDKPIVYVAGNHEFYSRDWTKHLHDLRTLATELGIYFLERESVEIGGFRFLGCSLWTDFEINGAQVSQECMREAQQRMTDYKRIKFSRTSSTADFYWVRSKHIVPALTQRRHRESVAWLDEQLTGRDPSRTVVVTHHAPHPRSIRPGYVGDSLTPAYVSNLEHLMGHAILWIHGHTHDSFDYEVSGTRVVCNPRGYAFGQPARGENDEFSPNLQFEVGDSTCAVENTP